jgi:hypothetical protein
MALYELTGNDCQFESSQIHCDETMPHPHTIWTQGPLLHNTPQEGTSPQNSHLVETVVSIPIIQKTLSCNRQAIQCVWWPQTWKEPSNIVSVGNHWAKFYKYGLSELLVCDKWYWPNKKRTLYFPICFSFFFFLVLYFCLHTEMPEFSKLYFCKTNILTLHLFSLPFGILNVN